MSALPIHTASAWADAEKREDALLANLEEWVGVLESGRGRRLANFRQAYEAACFFLGREPKWCEE